MSIATIKDTALAVANSAKEATTNAVCWAGKQVVWMKDTVVGLNLPSKTAGAASWTASKVQDGWNITYPYLASAAAFLATNNGMAACAMVGAGALIFVAVKLATSQKNADEDGAHAENNRNLILSITSMVSAVLLGTFAGVKFAQ